MTRLAPQPILGAALYVVHVAAYTTRNWTLAEGWPRYQVYDLRDAIHENPNLATEWRKDAERQLLNYLEEYHRKWPSPSLLKELHDLLRQSEGAGSAAEVAPEPIPQMVLNVTPHANYTTRNWTLTEGWPRQQINDLWEAIHEIPELLTRWRSSAERELLMRLDQYNCKWLRPNLRNLLHCFLGRFEGAHTSTPMAPEPILRAALYFLHHAAYTTRNWTLTDEWPRQQVNDLWEAIHEIPSLLTRWRSDAEQELLMYLDEYDRKWPSPRLQEMYRRHLEQGSPV